MDSHHVNIILLCCDGTIILYKEWYEETHYLFTPAALTGLLWGWLRGVTEIKKHPRHFLDDGAVGYSL